MPRKANLFHLGLSVELRSLRVQSGMSTRSVGEYLGVSAASVSRTETGRRTPGPDEVDALCTLFDVVGHRRDRLVQKTRDPEGLTVRLPPGDEFADQLANIALLEAESEYITSFELTFIPGLLQTPKYARVIISLVDRPEVEIERRVSARLARQGLLSSPNAPSLAFFLDEEVLRRPVGGPAVMRQQIAQLRQAAANDEVQIQVIPGSVGAHPGLEGAFAVYEPVASGPYVYLETPRGGLFLTKASETATYLDRVETLRRVALGPAETSDLLAEFEELYSDDGTGVAQEQSKRPVHELRRGGVAA